MLFGLGEVVLVVLGILIALQVETWTEERERSKEEFAILNQLKVEYESNLTQIEQKIQMRDEILNSSVTLLNYRLKEMANLNLDSVDHHITRTVVRPTFDPDLGVTSELTNSGRLYLLESDELRNHIAGLPSFLAELREEEQVIFYTIEERYLPFLIEKYQIGKVVMEWFSDDAFNSIHRLDGSRDSEYNEIDLFTRGDAAGLLQDPDMEDYLALTIANTGYTNIQSQGVKQKIEAILTSIDSELNRFEENK